MSDVVDPFCWFVVLLLRQYLYVVTEMKREGEIGTVPSLSSVAHCMDPCTGYHCSFMQHGACFQSFTTGRVTIRVPRFLSKLASPLLWSTSFGSNTSSRNGHFKSGMILSSFSCTARLTPATDVVVDVAPWR